MKVTVFHLKYQKNAGREPIMLAQVCGLNIGEAGMGLEAT